jgi:hypothetical protein
MDILEPIKQYINERPEAGERLRLCDKCEFFNRQKSTCELCGCYMYVKVMFKPSTCPMGKW